MSVPTSSVARSHLIKNLNQAIENTIDDVFGFGARYRTTDTVEPRRETPCDTPVGNLHSQVVDAFNGCAEAACEQNPVPKIATVGVGDVVILKSGGPLMTLIQISDDGKDGKCAWFEGNKGNQLLTPLSTLTLANTPEEDDDDEGDDYE